MKKISAITLVLALGFLAGCASVPMAPTTADQVAKRFQPAPGMANIYLYRNQTLGAAITMPISLDGRIAGKTARNVYFFWSVRPGKHTLRSHTENTSKLVIHARAGHNYFVWQQVRFGAFAPRSKLHLMSDAEGRKGVMECKLAQPEQD